MPRLLSLLLCALALMACAQQEEPIAYTDPVTGETTYGD